MNRTPVVGDTVFAVAENIYYVDGQAAPEMEFVVCEGTVEQINHYQNYRHDDAKVVLKTPDGKKTLVRYPWLSFFGKTVFFDREDAIKHAEEMTDEYERTWASLGVKLRRSWQ